jgi:hypothetical protein
MSERSMVACRPGSWTPQLHAWLRGPRTDRARKLGAHFRLSALRDAWPYARRRARLLAARDADLQGIRGDEERA